MKRTIALCLCLVFLCGCAGKAVTIPPPPDIAPAIKAVADSNMSPESKAVTIQQIMQSAERQYAAMLARAEKAGANAKDVIMQILSIGSSAAMLTLQATK
jgi:hypothetical protein